MNACMDRRTHACTHIRTHAHTHVHACTDARRHIKTCTYMLSLYITYINTCNNVIHKHTYAYSHTHAHTHATHTHARTHARTHVHPHTRTHAHPHTHTPSHPPTHTHLVWCHIALRLNSIMVAEEMGECLLIAGGERARQEGSNLVLRPHTESSLLLPVSSLPPQQRSLHPQLSRTPRTGGGGNYLITSTP